MSHCPTNPSAAFSKLKEAFSLPEDCVSATISLQLDGLVLVQAVFHPKDKDLSVLKEFYLCEKK